MSPQKYLKLYHSGSKDSIKEHKNHTKNPPDQRRRPRHHSAGTLWWTNTPHYPNEQHQHIADTIKNITDIGDDNNQTHPVKVNITTGLNLPAPRYTPARTQRAHPPNRRHHSPKHASTLSAPTVGLNITYTETGLTQTPEYSRPQMILPPSHQAALANFSASLEDPEGPLCYRWAREL